MTNRLFVENLINYAACVFDNKTARSAPLYVLTVLEYFVYVYVLTVLEYFVYVVHVNCAWVFCVHCKY